MPEILILQKETPRFQGHISQPYLNSPRKTFFFPKTSLQRLVYLLLLPGWETPKFHLNQFPLALFLVSKKDMPQKCSDFCKNYSISPHSVSLLPALSPLFTLLRFGLPYFCVCWTECRDEKFACTRLYSVHRPVKQCVHQVCFTR